MNTQLEEARNRIERAYRVKFNGQEQGKLEQAITELAVNRVAAGESFRWENRGNQPLIRFGLPETETEEDIIESDSLAMDAEETVIQTEVSQEVAKSQTEAIRQCDAKEAHYCRLRAGGMSMANAYVAAGYTGSTPNSASVCAGKLEKRPHVSLYIRSLKEAAWAANVLSLAEKRNFLAEVVRTPVSTLSEDSPLAQKLKVTTSEKGEYKEIEMPNKLKALELDAKLAGELKEQSNQSNAFQFNLIMERIEPQADATEIPLETNPPE